MRRRDVLAGLSATGLAAAGIAPGLIPRRAWALGDASKVDVVEIALPAGTLSRPEAWRQLLFELVQTTSIEAVDRVVALPPDDLSLFAHPFAALVGDGAFDPLPDDALEQLRRYLTYGGFLVIDDATASRRSEFDRSVRRLCARLFPNKRLHPLQADHSVYRSFFLLERPYGRLDTFDYLEGIQDGEIYPLIYCRNDLSGAMDRRADGRYVNACSPDGEWQRVEAVKLGINLVMYALTSNYKKDQAHVKQLMLEGRLE